MGYGILLQLRSWLAGKSLWLDEELIARNLRDRDFGQLAGALDHNQSAPLGWLWLQRAVLEIFGTGERALRLVPLLFGVGTLILAWLIGRRLFGAAGTIAVVSLLAVNYSVLHYADQVKQYTGDVFWVLLLLGLAIRCVRAPGDRRWTARWWATAAVGCFFSMGAILVTPGIGLVLVVAAWWPRRWSAALRAALPGLIWLAAFATHYWLALRHVLANPMMADYWARWGYPPEDAGPRRIATWSYHRLHELSRDPLGLDAGQLGDSWLYFVSILFWSLVLVGMLVAAYRGLPAGLLLAAPVVTAFVLAWLRMVPLTVRLAMWIIPALALATGYAVDALSQTARRPVRWSIGTSALLAMVAALVAVAPLVPAPLRPEPWSSLSDRDGVRWLVDQHRPGDLVLVLSANEHAVEWYAPGDALRPWYVVAAGRPDCVPGAFRRTLAGHRRVLVFGDRKRFGGMVTRKALNSYFTRIGATVQNVESGYRVVRQIVDLSTVRPSTPDPSPCLRLS